MELAVTASLLTSGDFTVGLPLVVETESVN